MYKKHIAFGQTDWVKQTFESIHYQFEFFFTSSGKLRIGANYYTRTIYGLGTNKNCFLITFYQFSML